jgi:hypothetical protein
VFAWTDRAEGPDLLVDEIEAFPNGARKVEQLVEINACGVRRVCANLKGSDQFTGWAENVRTEPDKELKPHALVVVTECG